jgi:hypothetical protein
MAGRGHDVKQDAVAGVVARGAIVYVGGEGGAVRDGGSTRSAMQCRESLPFSAWSLGCAVVLAQVPPGRERVNCGGRERPGWW